EELREVVAMERDALDRSVSEAQQSGDARRKELAEHAAAERNMQLEMLPPDLAGQVRELQAYDFTSEEARQRFEELLEKLREQLAQSYFKEMSGAMGSMSPADMQRMKDMLNELNQLLEQK